MPDRPPDSPSPSSESRATLRAGGDIKVAGDVAGRDLSKTINNILNIFTGKHDSLERRNRRVMLEKVRNFWVKGVLEQSLHGAALIELGMEYKPEAVQYPWATVLQRPDQPAQPLPLGTKAAAVFDEVSGELLILGAPGSGKTTMLLDLARDLIARAEQDETLPIPVVFNLSSWAEKRPPLAVWLVDELRFRYDVPKKIAEAWVKDDYVLPLLDGLDEVKLEHREACVEAINHFRQEHGLLPTVVCSRRADYEAINAQLRLRGAIVLQPLTREQIDRYLDSVGEQLASVRALLQRDAALQELAESPLMLSIMVLAYRGLLVESLPELTTIEAQRKHLFDNYVQQMFKHRGIDKRYTQKQVIHWLSWLAGRMVEHDQIYFAPGTSLQGLERFSQVQRFTGLASRLFLGLSVGIILDLVATFLWVQQVGLVLGLLGLAFFFFCLFFLSKSIFPQNKKLGLEILSFFIGFTGSLALLLVVLPCRAILGRCADPAELLMTFYTFYLGFLGSGLRILDRNIPRIMLYKDCRFPENFSVKFELSIHLQPTFGAESKQKRSFSPTWGVYQALGAWIFTNSPTHLREMTVKRVQFLSIIATSWITAPSASYSTKWAGGMSLSTGCSWSISRGWNH